ncbi:MAG: hypothetical protein H8E94_01125 [Alphaproteobacteria bacterium]|nr:hypothetical protein [Alphaproteobacteria bacterium]
MAEKGKRILPWALLALAGAVALVGYLVMQFVQTDHPRVDLPAIGGPLSLIDQNGNTVTE